MKKLITILFLAPILLFGQSTKIVEYENLGKPRNHVQQIINSTDTSYYLNLHNYTMQGIIPEKEIDNLISKIYDLQSSIKNDLINYNKKAKYIINYENFITASTYPDKILIGYYFSFRKIHKLTPTWFIRFEKCDYSEEFYIQDIEDFICSLKNSQIMIHIIKNNIK